MATAAPAAFRIDQIDANTWRLSSAISSAIVTQTGGWKVVNLFGSQAAASAAMTAIITQSQAILAPPQFFDATGAVTVGP